MKDRPSADESVEERGEDIPSAKEGTAPSTTPEAIGLGKAQHRAREAAEDLLVNEFEGVINVEAADDNGWRTVVEVVERSAVPDTQDIIGRYEITLDATGEVTGYELVERYRRGQMKEEL